VTRSYLQAVQDESQVAEARRTAATLARQHGLGDEGVSNVSIVVTEAATNLIKHAGGGQLLFRTLKDGGGKDLGVEVVSIDKGPGIANVAKSLADGYSTAGTPGNGLGAIQRQSSVFDIYSRPGEGTVWIAEVWEWAEGSRAQVTRRTAPLVGVVNVPVKGEEECGDSWAVHHEEGRTSVTVIDGLGHGVMAAEASRAGIEAFEQSPGRGAGEQMQVMHGALRATRGAAGAVAVIDHARGTVDYCGIGNISGVLVADGAERHLVSHNGTMGHEAKVRNEFSYPWAEGALLIMASDGIATRWSVAAMSGLTRKHPAVIAGVIYRDYCRGRDDTTVVVVADTRGGA
jgi:anti-sigma regulatory factor (Ser/Thr protein kinase)